MHLSPREVDKLLLCSQLGQLAQRRLARGLQLNYAEACALLTFQTLELIRDGRHTVTELMSIGRRILGRRHVLPAVPHLLNEIQVEGTFPDGTKLVTIHSPIATEDGDLELALYGSFLPLPAPDKFPPTSHCGGQAIAPGAIRHPETVPPSIELNIGRQRIQLKVTNDGDRAIQVGSHYHFIETNRMLRFDRRLAYGYRLDIPAGAAVRFEPGESKIVRLVQISGNQIISGGNRLASGPVDPKKIDEIIQDIVSRGFKHKTQTQDKLLESSSLQPYKMLRSSYALAYGPTVGDQIRLADTDLWLEIERDLIPYGDESVFGGGKVIREGMGQSSFVGDDRALDLVITNVVIVDYSGIYKADVGIKHGIIVGIGKSGNPDVMQGVDEKMIIGTTTEVLAGEGKILTAGGLDTHIHFICPQLCIEALSSGTTTLIGGGTGPNTGTNATTCTPGKNNIRFMLQATDSMPLNFGFTGKGNCSVPEPLEQQIRAGAIGLKLHEDWGTTPSAIDNCLTVCEEYDVQATIHTDTLNESGFVEDSISAFKNRTIHTYHSEGAGGGHAPDIIKVCSYNNVIPSSTNPTRPYTKNTIDEHLDMLMVCHHLNPSLPEDIAFAESRIRGETIGAEDLLQDLGAISIISSDSQAMGRVGEVICRTWQTADKMKKSHGKLVPPQPQIDNENLQKADNFRIRRYVAKYTINPALAHGVAHLVGSIEVGKLADLVLWTPAMFGTKPDCVLKSGTIVWSQMGDANASIPTPQPYIGRPMFGSHAGAVNGTPIPNSVAFVSQWALDNNVKSEYHLKKRVEAARGCRAVKKSDMKLNNFMPAIEVDPETYQVTVDGRPSDIQPTDQVSMSRN